MTEDQTANDQKTKKPKFRSPNYPSINLARALELVKAQYDTDGMQRIPVKIAHERWGYKPGGSPGDLIVAALKAYGLIEVDGNGEKRQVRLTETSRKIMLDHPEKVKILQEVALTPTIHKELWDHFAGDIPRDDVLKHYLIWDRKFNEKSVAGFIAQFRDTISLAKLTRSDILPSRPESSGPVGQNDFGERMNGIAITPQPVSAKAETNGPQVLITQDFSIPRRGGRQAILRLEYPISNQDIEQIRKWLDLMENTLAEESAGTDNAER